MKNHDFDNNDDYIYKYRIVKFKMPYESSEVFKLICENINKSIILSDGYKHNIFGINIRNHFCNEYFIDYKKFESIGNTGDILLFKGYSNESKFQRFITDNGYDHVGLREADAAARSGNTQLRRHGPEEKPPYRMGELMPKHVGLHGMRNGHPAHREREHAADERDRLGRYAARRASGRDDRIVEGPCHAPAHRQKREANNHSQEIRHRSVFEDENELTGIDPSVLSRYAHNEVGICLEAPLEVLVRITGFALTRGILCAMRRKPLPDPASLLPKDA